jgi:hypothetical protein
MPAVGLCQPSVAVADRAPLLQIVPEPPNRKAAHTASQPQRYRSHTLLCVSDEDVPGGWICRHRAQPNFTHIPPPHGHLGAAVAFGRGPLAGKHYQPPQLALDFCCC